MEVNDDDEEEQEENEEEVVVDQDYYYDSYKDYNEEPPSAPSKERTFSQKEIMNDVKGNQSHCIFSLDSVSRNNYHLILVIHKLSFLFSFFGMFNFQVGQQIKNLGTLFTEDLSFLLRRQATL